MMTVGLKTLLDRYDHREIPREYSGLKVYHIPKLAAYFKVGEIARNSNLVGERDALVWLAGKLAVPSLIDFESSDSHEYILISEIVGDTYSEQITTDTPPEQIEILVEHVGKEIRKMHDLSIDDCPFDQRLSVKLKKAEENIRGGFVDESDFDAENLGKTGRQIFDELNSSLPLDQDLVFTHGDMCLPNIMIRDACVSGFIDLDRAGVADRYQDISLFLRSFSVNSESARDITAAFCRGYGINSLDRAKIDFYRKLDELF